MAGERFDQTDLPVENGPDGELQPFRDPKTVPRHVEMLTDRFLTEAEYPGDLPVGLSMNCQEKTITLAWCQPRRSRQRRRSTMSYAACCLKGERANELGEQKIRLGKSPAIMSRE